MLLYAADRSLVCQKFPIFWGSPSAGRSFLQYLELGVVEVREHDLVGGVAAVLLCCILILEQTEQLAAVRRVQSRRVVQVSSPNLLNTGCFWWSDGMVGLTWDRGVCRAGGQPLWLPTALTGWWNISNLRQPKHLQDHQNNLEVTDNGNYLTHAMFTLLFHMTDLEIS